jgi:hypothetical protein
MLFIERYKRRIENFRRYLDTDSLVIFIIGNYNSDLSELKNIISEKYHSLHFEILHYIPKMDDFEIFDTLMKLMENTSP